MAVDYPYETVEILLSCAAVIFDDGMFLCEAELYILLPLFFIPLTAKLHTTCSLTIA